MAANTSVTTSSDRTFYLICATLLLATIGVYWNAWQFDYVNYDDPNNVSKNPIVLGGLTLSSFVWGATTSYFEYWHPVTWWSHTLDSDFFGAAPGGRHLVNLLFHLANTLLVFIWLRHLTGALWRSAIVAALFALHPMQVESVAWISERKDVLAAFFGLLCLLMYSRYARETAGLLREPSFSIRSLFRERSYCWALGFFALGLMSKPTVVTWPCLMLLLDWWPLQRVELSGFRSQLGALRRLLMEKVPFFLLTVLSSFISYLSLKGETGKVLDGVEISTAFRLTNVPVSYIRYLGKLFWPDDLAVLYPLPAGLWPWWQIVGSVVLLLLISLLVWRWGRQVPALLVGWLIFLGVLVPASGIVGVGLHSMADRFTYLPSLGLWLCLVWGGAELCGRIPVWARPLKLGIALVLLAFGVTCWHQVRHWQNSEALWRHCLVVNSENAVAHHNLAHFLHHSGRASEAVPHYQEAIRIMPRHVDAPLNLGAISFSVKDYPTATNYFQQVLQIKPDYSKAHMNLGMALNELKDFTQASNHLARAAELAPDNIQIRCLYALSLVELGHAPGAIAQATAALQLDPNNGVAYALLARGHALRGERSLARQYLAQAVQLAPGYADGYLWLGVEALHSGDLSGALAALEVASRLAPDSAAARFNLAATLVQLNQVAEGITQYREALRLSPDWVPALNNLAWLLATASANEHRNGAEAVQFALRACEITEYKEVLFIGTLAAAHAEAGDFSAAVALADRAARLAREQGQSKLAETNEKLRELFRNQKPFHEAN